MNAKTTLTAALATALATGPIALAQSPAGTRAGASAEARPTATPARSGKTGTTAKTGTAGKTGKTLQPRGSRKPTKAWGVTWQPDLDTALARAADSHKPVVWFRVLGELEGFS